MFYKVRNKELDLLAAYYRKDEDIHLSHYFKSLFFPILFAFIVLVIYMGISISNGMIENQIEEAKLTSEANELKVDDTEKKAYEELQTLQKQEKEMQELVDTFFNSASLSQDYLQGLQKSLLKNMTIESMNYNKESQSLTLILTSLDVLNIEKYITTIKKDAKYQNVSYSGYQQVGQTSNDENNSTQYQYRFQLTLSLKEEAE